METIDTPQRITIESVKGAVRREDQEAAIVQVMGDVPVKVILQSVVQVLHDESSQAWFWTPAWQAGEQRASRELAEGRGRVFRTPEEFLASLDD
jgi:hypothetical protein